MSTLTLKGLKWPPLDRQLFDKSPIWWTCKPYCPGGRPDMLPDILMLEVELSCSKVTNPLIWDEGSSSDILAFAEIKVGYSASMISEEGSNIVVGNVVVSEKAVMASYWQKSNKHLTCLPNVVVILSVVWTASVVEVVTWFLYFPWIGVGKFSSQAANSCRQNVSLSGHLLMLSVQYQKACRQSSINEINYM